MVWPIFTKKLIPPVLIGVCRLGSGPRGAPPLGCYHQQVTLYDIRSLKTLLTQPRPASITPLVFNHTNAISVLAATGKSGFFLGQKDKLEITPFDAGLAALKHTVAVA